MNGTQKIPFGWHSYASRQLDTIHLGLKGLQWSWTLSLEQYPDSRTLDIQICHTAVSDSRWRRFYLGGGTKAQLWTSSLH